MSYHELSVAERATIQIGLLNKFSQRRIARLLNRSPSVSGWASHLAGRFPVVRQQLGEPTGLLRR